MWDPRSYRDADYGLTSSEYFEPDQNDEPELDLSQPHIMTVLGPIEPDELGMCLPFERVLQRPQLAAGTSDPGALDRVDLSAEELEHFTSLGGRSIVDITAADEGRTPAGLLTLTQRVPSHIIVSASIPAGLVDADPGRIVGHLMQEFDTGIELTRIRAGVISIGGSLPPSALQPVLAAAAETGSAIFTGGYSTLELRSLLAAAEVRGISPDRVVVVNNPKDASIASVNDILRCGATAGLGLAGADPDPALVAVIDVLERGDEDRLLVSLGGRSATDLRSYGGRPGWPYLLEYWMIEAMQRGASTQQIRQLVVDNPARVLAKVHKS